VPLVVAVALIASALVWAGWAVWTTTAPPEPGAAAAAPVGMTLPAPIGEPQSVEAQPVVARSVVPQPSQPAPRIWRQRDPDGDQTPDLADHVNQGERPSMPEVIERLQRAGVHTGLGAFSPPGTRPPLVGLAVPEDFVLPPGMVRHHQATDDGQRIEAILMYAPTVQFAGMPPNRVVPPELAPPGLPIRRIVVPDPLKEPSP
jgi:hypothetical protein